ncbi:glycosyltransferase family 4 protein [Lunatimonas salinarum]|uniref:glycosyltransferase family 4 protein n=1 Tax=Lunatimonas salinarum TaxID=1774590 RepID=UPI001AE02533|nr:glycosyltransferase family 4 protein [Lunatimonas salinarum]
MRVLIINSDAIYSRDSSFLIHKSTGEFLSRLAQRGFDVSIFHFAVPLKEASIANFSLEQNCMNVVAVPRGYFKLFSYFKALIWFCRLVKDVDFVYLFYPNSFSIFLGASFLLGKPFGLYLRGERNIQSSMSRFLYKKAKFVATVSPKFTDIVGSAGGRGFTIKPMIDFGIEDIRDNRKEFSKENLSLLFIGRVEREKGVFELLDAVSELNRIGVTNFRLNIIGHGRHYREIASKIRENRLDHLVTLHGVITNRKDIKRFYEDADLFVFPTYHEGFPRVLYEAMIFDTPIVTTFVGSIPYLLQDKFNCYRIKEQDVNSIVDVLLPILRDYRITFDIARNASSTIKSYLETNNLLHEDIVQRNFMNRI